MAAWTREELCEATAFSKHGAHAQTTDMTNGVEEFREDCEVISVPFAFPHPSFHSLIGHTVVPYCIYTLDIQYDLLLQLMSQT